MTAADRDRRQRVWLEAAERFARGQSSGAAAALLRLTVRSVERWRQAWESGGVDVLRSRGPGARCRLDDGQLTRLEAELDRGPGVHGWADQRWILARIREMTICLFGVEDPVPGVWLLLCRRGWSCQMPARRAVERDDGAVEVWRKEVWSRAKNRRDHRWGGLLRGRGRAEPAAAAGEQLGRRGSTPVTRVRDGSSGRVSIAGLACFRPGQQSRLFYRTRRHRGRKGEPKAFTWEDYRDLICAAHRRRGRPIVLIWDNRATHRCAAMTAFAEENELWLTVVWLPSYTPDLNPVESVWSLLEHGEAANRVLTGVDHLAGLVGRGLRRIQRHPQLLDGCLAATGPTLKPA